MSLHNCVKLFQIVKHVGVIKNRSFCSTIRLGQEICSKQFKTENNVVYLEDPENFGTLSKNIVTDNVKLEDKDDIKENKYLQEKPLPSQKLTTRQYADLIKQYLKYKRLKEAIDVLEVRMLTQDEVTPENYIYNILIGGCADVGYTKKAFKLYNDMKRRSLKPTGDTYTCLFHACANSPYPVNGLKHAHNLRNLMIEKDIEPNLTIYNSMIKAFGRCGDIPTAFKIVDEMISKKIKLRVHTFNHILQACISDKKLGLRHALVVWRKMLSAREKPNIYSFNLILKCVKDCGLGSKADIEELVSTINEHIQLSELYSNNKRVQKLINTNGKNNLMSLDSEQLRHNDVKFLNNGETINQDPNKSLDTQINVCDDKDKDIVSLEFVGKMRAPMLIEKEKVPNLLSKSLKMNEVLSLQEVTTPQEKFAVIGGQDEFLKEMDNYSVKPDLKTFTQMLSLIDESREAEEKLIEIMKSSNLKADIDFYNMLIKKRCMRLDYEGAFDVKEMIIKENKYRSKRYHFNKKIRLKMNIMTYGVLALACNSKESAEKLLNEMRENQLKINIVILGTLLKHGTVNNDFSYILYIMNIVKEESLQVNHSFVKTLELFNDKWANRIKKNKSGLIEVSKTHLKEYKTFYGIYNSWMKEIDFEELMEMENPWKQFKENYPETVQRQKDFNIIEPKKFYKRNRKYVSYAPLK